MTTPAAGNRLLIGFAREQEYNVPDPRNAFEYWRPILPFDGDFTRPEAAGGEMNPWGFMEPGVPGPISGPLNVAGRFSAALPLLPLENICGGLEKDTLDTGIFKYTGTPTISGLDTSIFGIWGLSPVDKGFIYGIKFSAMNLVIGNNNAIPCRFTGAISQGCRVGQAVPAEGNTGTYTKGPVIRGMLADPAGGDIAIKVSRVTTSIQVKIEQAVLSIGYPAFTFPGAAIDIVYDPATGRATWQNGVDETGLDLGIWDENRDPLEFIFPGTATDHADLAVGDIFVFPVSWTLPQADDEDFPGFLAGQRFTSAHWINRVRAITDPESEYSDLRVLTGTLALNWPLTPDQGSGSRYLFGLDRDQALNPTLQLNRKYTDRWFLDNLERGKRFQMQNLFLGRQLSAAYRESVQIDWASVAVAARTANVANAAYVPEALTLRGETNDAGDSPLVITVITDRDFTIAT